MSAKFKPDWVERRFNIDLESGARQRRFLVIGKDADRIAAAFVRILPHCYIESASRADHAILAMSSGHFDATLVDCRDDERFHRLAVVAARQFKQGRVALLASDYFLPDDTAVLENLEIFGSSDDSDQLLASLGLATKNASSDLIPEKAVAISDARDDTEFEDALRKELEALQERRGNLSETDCAPAAAPAMDPAALSGITASPPADEIAQHPQARQGGDFLTDMAVEIDAALSELIISDDAAETAFIPPWRAEGKIDLFGNPVSELDHSRTSAPPSPLTGELAEMSASTENLDLFRDWSPRSAVSVWQLASAPGQTVTGALGPGLDLFNDPICDADCAGTTAFTVQPFAGTEADISSGYHDLFDFYDAERGGNSGDATDAASTGPDKPGFSAAMRTEPQAIQFAPMPAQVIPEALAPQNSEEAPVMPTEGEPKPALKLPGVWIEPQTTFQESGGGFPLNNEEPGQQDARTKLLASTSWLANLLPRLTPLYSVVYKNLALVILSALFTAFVAFGVMIVFFLTSNKWSAPITLSRGHELVKKVERDLGDFNVRKNQISEQIDDARKNLKSSQDELDRVHSLAGMIEGTISAEIKNRSELRAETEAHTEALRKVAAQYGNDALNPQFKGDLAHEYDRRLINRNIFEAGKLAQLEAAHRTALIRNEIAANEVEINRLNSTLAALNGLVGRVEGAATPVAGVGGADLVPLLNQVIEVRKGASEAASGLKAAESRGALLSDSLKTVETSIRQIGSTPLARAINENVTVLFVPYENADQYAQGNVLYSCAVGIFLCSDAGKVGRTIEGETVATHPFFNKPVRGSFVEAELTDQDAARKEILHVKRRPLFF